MELENFDQAPPGTMPAGWECGVTGRGNALEDNVSLYYTARGKRNTQQEDDHIAAGGAVGLWTKADSVTAFDDFSYGVMAK